MMKILLPMILAAVFHASADQSVMSILSVGKIETMPDEVIFQITVHSVDTNRDSAKGIVDGLLTNLYSEARKIGVDTTDIATVHVAVRPNYRWENQKEIYDGEMVAHELRIHVRHLGILQQLYGLTSRNKEVSIGRIQFTHSKMDSLENEAEIIAAKNAIARIRSLATATGQKLGRILSIRNYSDPDEKRVQLPSNSPGSGHGFGFGGSGGSGPSEQTIIMPEKLTIEASVIVSYTIK